MKKWGLIAGLVFYIFSMISVWHLKKEKPKEKKTLISIFTSVPISEKTPSQLPCVNIEIEGRTYVALLDLGFNGHAAIKNEHLKDISTKKFVKSKVMHGWRGKQYEETIYEVPKIKMGNLSLQNPFLYEQNPSLSEDAYISRDKENKPGPQAKIGWKFFKFFNLLLDLRNSKIAFCTDLDTLKENGYDLTQAVKVPLILEHDLIEIQTTGPNGPLRCLLDTGATWNILNTESKNNVSPEEMALNPDNMTQLSFLKIGGQDFGAIEFHTFPIQLPFKIEAILGVEFLKEHLIFLDLVNGFAYIAKNQTQ